MNNMKQNEDSEIKIYSKLARIRNLLKQAQQISWNIDVFDKKYPLSGAHAEDYPAIEESYKVFIDELYRLVDLFENLEKEYEDENNQD